ncbi:MAG: hypothetical protein JO325_06745 [Solirubrobacterales bacterium]|nr:hypothetical protein [Solirubrobacterales bacterium]
MPAELRALLTRSLTADAVNRPPAGEWQRALRGLLADGRLSERYPGPAPARAVVRAGPAARPAVAVARSVAPPRAASPTARSGAQMRRGQPSGALWLRRAVVVAWVVAGALVLLLALSRLFAAAIPTVPSDGGAGAASQFGQGATSPYTGSQFGRGAGSPYPYQYYPRARAVPGFVP